MSKWIEISNNYTDGKETTIVGWELTDIDGKTITVINHNTKEVEYKDDFAKTDEYAQKKIKEVLDRI